MLKEAMILARHNATSMHDVARGGIRETSLEIDIDQIPARSIVDRFSQAFSFDPLRGGYLQVLSSPQYPKRMFLKF